MRIKCDEIFDVVGEVVVEEGRGGDISISRRGALSINRRECCGLC